MNAFLRVLLNVASIGFARLDNVPNEHKFHIWLKLVVFAYFWSLILTRRPF